MLPKALTGKWSLLALTMFATVLAAPAKWG